MKFEDAKRTLMNYSRRHPEAINEFYDCDQELEDINNLCKK